MPASSRARAPRAGRSSARATVQRSVLADRKRPGRLSPAPAHWARAPFSAMSPAAGTVTTGAPAGERGRERPMPGVAHDQVRDAASPARRRPTRPAARSARPAGPGRRGGVPQAPGPAAARALEGRRATGSGRGPAPCSVRSGHARPRRPASPTRRPAAARSADRSRARRRATGAGTRAAGTSPRCTGPG